MIDSKDVDYLSKSIFSFHTHDQITFSIKLILMNNGLAFRRNSLISYLGRHFCQTKAKASIFSTISPDAQKALWAREIITKIAYADQRHAEDIMNPSLRQLIINCQAPTKDFAFDDIHKKEVISMFKEGIHLNLSAFSQARVLDARNIGLRLTFCPNLLVTRPVFLNLLKPSKYTVYQDCSEISKTIAIIMFIELSRHIHKYIYNAVCSGDKTLEQEYKMLRSRNYLHPTNKYWYWSIQTFQEQRTKKLQDVIASQASQLSQQKQLEIYNCPTLAETIKLAKFYYSKTEINHISVVDKIDYFAQIMRQWNDYQQKHRFNIESQKQFENASFRYKQAVDIIKHFKQFINISTNQNSCIIISSNCFEADFMFRKSKSNQKYGPLSLQVIDKDSQTSTQELCILKFSYLANLFKNWGKNDFWHCFWFQFSRNINVKLFEERWMQLRTNFLKHVSKFEIRQYYRFFKIYRFLRKNYDNLFQFPEAKQDEAQKMIAKIMQTFDDQCFPKFIQHSKEFIKKKGDQSLIIEFLRAMYIIALNKKFRGEKQLIISLDQIAKQVKTKSLTPLQYFHSNLHDKQLIPIENINQLTKEVKIFGQAEHFCTILQHIIYRSFYYQLILMNSFQLFLLKNDQFLESLLKGLITFQLKKGTILQLTKFNQKRDHKVDNNQKKKVQSTENRDEKLYQKVKFQIKSASSFPAFPQKQKKYNRFAFQKSIAKLIEQCDQNPDQWVAGIPKLPPRDDQQPQLETDANVNFILAKCQGSGKNKKYLLNCVDLSIFGSSFTEKQAKAKKLYRKLLKQSQKKFQVNHIILCMQKSCLGYLKEDESSLNVIYSDLESVRFVKAIYPNELVRFEGVQRYLLLKTIERQAKEEQ